MYGMREVVFTSRKVECEGKKIWCAFRIYRSRETKVRVGFGNAVSTSFDSSTLLAGRFELHLPLDYLGSVTSTFLVFRSDPRGEIMPSVFMFTCIFLVFSVRQLKTLDFLADIDEAWGWTWCWGMRRLRGGPTGLVE